MEVVVCPNARNLSKMRSREASSGKYNFKMKQSSPVNAMTLGNFRKLPCQFPWRMLTMSNCSRTS